MANSYIDLIIDRENNNYDIHDKRIPTLPNDETKYLNGKGQWTVPDGSGGGGPTPSGDPTEYYNGAGQWSKPITLSGNPDEYYNGQGGWSPIPVDTDTKNTAGSTAHQNTTDEEVYFICVRNNDGSAYQQTYIPTRAKNGVQYPAFYMKSGVSYAGGLKIKDQAIDWDFEETEDTKIFHRLFISATAPSNKQVGDVWIDLNVQ